MSQAKVEKHKQEKYNRKNTPKQSRIKEYLGYAAATLVALALIIYFGYSVAIETGLYKPEETTCLCNGSITAKNSFTLDSSGMLSVLQEAKAEAETEATKEEASTGKLLLLLNKKHQRRQINL